MQTPTGGLPRMGTQGPLSREMTLPWGLRKGTEGRGVQCHMAGWVGGGTGAKTCESSGVRAGTAGWEPERHSKAPV